MDEIFRKKISSLIDEALIPHGIKSPPLDRKILDYQNELDFLYGQKAGFIEGLIIGYYIAKHGHVPKDDELSEMTKLVESRIIEIKKSISDMEI